jgi:4-diphosphocytidyl-2-C-methyl-D-erythritol kinase
MDLKAYAKINLSLDIVGRREDGYHLLRTVMQSISLCDYLKIELNKDNKINVVCSDPSLPSGNKNIAYKAAEKLIVGQKWDIGCNIIIDKRIPSQAGLGGGSADAAAVIRGLLKLMNAGVDGKVIEIAASVGADVPFCLIGGTALCEGIGEKITPVCKLPDCGILVCKPDKGISTKEAYSLVDASDDGYQGTDVMIESLKTGRIKQIAGNLSNVFDRVTSNSSIDSIKHELISLNTLGTQLSGSGSAVFGIFSSVAEAEKAKEKIMIPCWKGVFSPI